MGRARDFLALYARTLAAVIVVGEALVLARTDKYWPQGMDEFAFAAALMSLASRPLTEARLSLMLAAWCFLFGSLYTMLFSRLDPHGGSGERLAGLVLLMAACVAGAAWTWQRLAKALAAPGGHETVEGNGCCNEGDGR